MVRLRLLGPAEVLLDDGGAQRPVPLQPKRLALLAYLAASARGVHRRDTLLGLLWPEADGRHARGALSKALHYLRRALGEGVLLTQGDEEVRVDPERLWCDVAAFRQALEGGRPADALALYRGPLLDGVFLPDAPEFERWVDREREGLRLRAAAAAWALAEAAEDSGDLVGAIERARHAHALSPEDETGLRRLLALLERADDRAGAVAAYHAFARYLAAEYEVEPAAETQALIAGIRDARFAPAPAWSGDGEAAAPLPPLADTPPPVATPAAEPSGRDAEGPRGWRLAHAASWGGLAVAALSLVVFLSPRSAAPVLHPERVLVVPLENRTGDPALDPVGAMAADWVIQGLHHTGLVQAVPFAVTLSSLRGLAETGGAAPASRSLAEETGAGLVITGSYYLQGDSLYLKAIATDAATGLALVAPSPTAAPRSQPLAAVEGLRQRLMAGLAPHLDPRLADHARIAGPTPSYPAYLAYAEGMERFTGADWRGAAGLFARAAGHDSTYALPLVMAAIAYANLGDYAAVDSLARRIEPLRRGLAEYDRQALVAVMAWSRGDYAASHRAAVRVAELAPNTIPHAQVGMELLMLNRPREALAAFAELDPTRGELRRWPVYWHNLTAAHHVLGGHRREGRAARRARALHPNDPAILALELRALAAQGRTRAVLRAVDEHLRGPSGASPQTGPLLRQTALELRAHGHPDAARQLLDRALHWHRARPEAEQARPGQRRELAETLYLAGGWEEAEGLLRALEASARDDVPLRGRLGTIAVRRGDRAGAEQAEAWLAALDRPYLLGEHTLWRARIAALRGDREGAVALLRAAFREGRYDWPALHADPDLEPLWDYPPFRRLLRPEG